MNETKSSRYHRLRRQAGLASAFTSSALLLALVWLRPSLSVAAYVTLLVLANAILTLPFAYYRGVVLERRYELSSQSWRAWAKDQLKSLLIALVFAVPAAEFVYLMIRWWPTWWWVPASVGAALFTLFLAAVAPVLLLPLFYRFTPLDRPVLRDRLLALCERADIAVLGVYQWALGVKTRRANAALTGAGKTRRILLSDTLLADYTDDEIEVILAHELAHHVHGDIPKGIVLDAGLITLALAVASVALSLSVAPLGLSGPADPRGLPIVLLCIGLLSLAATPFLNAWSRRNERRADRFALELTSRREAFVTAMRRLGAQNLSEENPSRLTVWLFHSHPPIEARIAAAKETV